MMLIYYKTWIYQCLIKQVKSPSICSRVPETGSNPPIGSVRESGRDSMPMSSVTTITGSINDTHIPSPYRFTNAQCKCQ